MSHWRCHRCGDANPPAVDVCWNCGADRSGTANANFKPDSLSDDSWTSPTTWRLPRVTRTSGLWFAALVAGVCLYELHRRGYVGWAALAALLLIVGWFALRPTLRSVMKQELESQLAPYDQEHLLRFWDRLSADEQQQLAEEIRSLDLDLVRRLYTSGPSSRDWAALARRAEPPPAFRLHGNNAIRANDARRRGEQALRAGHVGAILVAGGQGTRLGFDHPKGMFPIGPVSKSSLFRILLEKVLATSRRYGRPIPLYLMTSPATHEETVDYLQRHDYFGLPEQDVHVFCQGVMPAVDEKTGRLLLASPGHLALSPDGHGGMLAALESSGGLADIERRGLRQLFYFQVDNPLVVVCDPEFLGYHILAGSEMSTQVVAKQTPRDNVGNVVQIDGRVQILEYSDLNPLPDEIVLRQQPDGSPVFWAGNIGVHVFEAAFLQRMAGSSESLPFHVAHKKVPYIDEQGQSVEPSEPNALKFERFIFDLLPAAEQSIVMEVDEASTFAPLKNAPGAERDSPERVQAQMMNLHRKWLRQAGVTVSDDVPVEIGPLYALDAEELKTKQKSGSAVREATFWTDRDQAVS